MIILLFFIIPSIYVLIKLFFHFLTHEFGKISYDGFSSMGFEYNSEKDIFYSTKNAWQKEFGYCHLYDIGAPVFRMIIDTEPIRFYYDNKNWLIVFWKGQYGILTGAEIGVYNTNKKHVNKNSLYYPIEDKDMLDMSIILYRKDIEIMRMKDIHWWLAIFKIGMFSNPKDLSMMITIDFKDKNMLEAFMKSFKKLGHNKNSYKVEDLTFSFNFKKAKTHKVCTRSLLADLIRQHYNKKNVMLYNAFLADIIDSDGEDDSKIINQKKLLLLNKFLPDIINNSYDMDINNTSENIYLNDSVYSKIRGSKND